MVLQRACCSPYALQDPALTKLRHAAEAGTLTVQNLQSGGNCCFRSTISMKCNIYIYPGNPRPKWTGLQTNDLLGFWTTYWGSGAESDGSKYSQGSLRILPTLEKLSQ